MKEDPLDLIFVLGVVTGVAHIFIFNPIVYGMFDIKRNGKIVNKKYYERTIFQNVFLNLAEIFKCMIITVLVVATYELINTTILAITNQTASTIPVKGEPILYASFFIIYYQLYESCKNLVLRLIDKKKGKIMSNYLLIPDLEQLKKEIATTKKQQFYRLADQCDRYFNMPLSNQHPAGSTTYMGIAMINLSLFYLLTEEKSTTRKPCDSFGRFVRMKFGDMPIWSMSI